MNILFWNTQKKDLSNAIKEIIIEHDIDIISITEECDNKIIINNFTKASTSGKLTIFTKYNKIISLAFDEINGRMSAIQIKTPINGDILICFVHLISKIHSKEHDQMLESCVISNKIKELQKEKATDRVIICGDFNQNPHEKGIIAGNGFNAIPDKIIAKTKGSRKIQGEEYKYFFNPMWRFYGNQNRPLGTYFFNTNGHCDLHWNILDQFLLSSSLLKIVKNDIIDVNIISKTNNHNLIKANGIIDNTNYSDHLPIVMKLEI